MHHENLIGFLLIAGLVFFALIFRSRNENDNDDRDRTNDIPAPDNSSGGEDD